MWARWGGFALVALLAVAQLGSPFTGDQALFTVMGEHLRHGDVLYADRWDVKQPLLYLWYAAATLVGDDEVGVHVAEALWLLGFVLLAPRLLRDHLATRRAALLAPLLAVGAYYVVAEPLDRTQAEAIAGPIAFLACWSAVTAVSADPTAAPVRAQRLVLAGVFVGAAAMVKLTIAPMAAAGLLVVLLTGPLRGRAWLRRTAVLAGWSLAGFGLVLVVVASWLAAAGALDEAVDLVFGYLPNASGRGGRQLAMLRHTYLRFALMYLPLGLLALAWATRLRPSSWGERPPRLLLAMAAWLVLMVPVTAAQNGWKYLPQIAVIPLGVLAAAGLDVVLGWPDRGRRTALALVAVSTIVPILLAAPLWSTLVRHDLGLHREDRERLGAEHELAYRRGAALRDEVLVPGDLYVLGNPLLHHVTGRPLGTRVHSWAGEQPRAEEWADVLSDLQHRPPAVIVVSRSHAMLADRHVPGLWTVLDDGYCEVGAYDTDTWYVRRDLAVDARSGQLPAGASC